MYKQHLYHDPNALAQNAKLFNTPPQKKYSF